jgi:hypothetical protein
MSSLLRTALLSTVLACTFGCSFFQLDEKDLEVPPKKVEAAAGKAGEAAAGTSAMSAGGTSATPGGDMGGMAPTNAGGGGTAGM